MKDHANGHGEQTVACDDSSTGLGSSTNGSVEFFNRRRRDYSGFSGDQASDWGWMKIIHAEDLTWLMEYYRFVVASGELGEMAVRFRRFGGEDRAFCYGRSRCSMNPAWWNGGRQTAGNETDPSRL
jgi:hypothetical protein